MGKLLASRRGRFIIIFVAATILGIINAVIIFNLTHQFGYATKALPAIIAMSEDDKNIIVDNERDYKYFSSYAKEYNIYMLDNIPESMARAWFVFDSNNPKRSEDSNNLIPGFHVVSEIIADDYSAFELEKL